MGCAMGCEEGEGEEEEAYRHHLIRSLLDTLTDSTRTWRGLVAVHSGRSRSDPTDRLGHAHVCFVRGHGGRDACSTSRTPNAPKRS